MPIGATGQPDGTVMGVKPIQSKVSLLEKLRYCIDCRSRYGSICKYCGLDGTCSRHGMDFVNGKCPICGRTFEEDWGEYIKWQERRWSLTRVKMKNERDVWISPEDTSRSHRSVK